MKFIDEFGNPLSEDALYDIIQDRIETDKETAARITNLKLRNKKLERMIKDLQSSAAPKPEPYPIDPKDVEAVMNEPYYNKRVEDSVEAVTLDSLIQQLNDLTKEIDKFLTSNVSDDYEVTNSIVRDILNREAKRYINY